MWGKLIMRAIFILLILLLLLPFMSTRAAELTDQRLVAEVQVGQVAWGIMPR